MKATDVPAIERQCKYKEIYVRADKLKAGEVLPVVWDIRYDARVFSTCARKRYSVKQQGCTVYVGKK